MLHQDALQRRHPVDDREADIAGQAQRRDRVREQAVEAVGDGGEQQRVGAAPALVAFQQRLVADIEPEAAAIDDQLGQRRDVADADIEALAGDRMDHMRRLADQREPPRDVALGLHQRQMIGPARPDRLDRAEKPAEAGAQFGGELGFGQRQQARREVGVLGPHDRRTPARAAWPGGSSVIGRIANGPAGRKCSTAMPACGRSCATVVTMPICR